MWPLRPAGPSPQSWVHRSGEQENGPVWEGASHTPHPGPCTPPNSTHWPKHRNTNRPLAAWTRSQGGKVAVSPLPGVLLGCPEPSQDSPPARVALPPPCGGAAGLHGGEGPRTPGSQQPQEHPRLCLPHRRGRHPPPRAWSGGRGGGLEGQAPCDGTRCGESGAPWSPGRECGRRMDGGAEARIPRPQGGVGP